MMSFLLAILALAIVLWLLGDTSGDRRLAELSGLAAIVTMAIAPLVRPLHPLLRHWARRSAAYTAITTERFACAPESAQTIAHDIPLPTYVPFANRATYAPQTTIHLVVQSQPPAPERRHAPDNPWPPLRAPGAPLHQRYFIIDLAARTKYRVYRALDIWTGKTVGIKQVVRPNAAHDMAVDILETCLLNEAALLASLPAGIAPAVVDYFWDGPALSLVTEWIAGVTLAETLEMPELSISCRFELAVSSCEAISQLHAMTPPLIHRDLKPENLIVTASGKVVPIDFGIAERLGYGRRLPARLGTLPYAAPEQRRGDPQDERTDVYALGIVLGEILAPIDHLPAIRKILRQATAHEVCQRLPSVRELHDSFMLSYELKAKGDC